MSGPRRIVWGPNAGQCPGGAEYGHGMTLTSVHGGDCCERWDNDTATWRPREAGDSTAGPSISRSQADPREADAMSQPLTLQEAEAGG